MYESRRSRRILALLAAYVVALQALLLPLTVAAGAAYEQGLCLTASIEQGTLPSGHDTGCACAAGCGMQCCAQALAAPPAIHAASVGTAIGIVAPVVVAASNIKPQGKGPHNPRAPPAV